jgi:hypothetical protein
VELGAFVTITKVGTIFVLAGGESAEILHGLWNTLHSTRILDMIMAIFFASHNSHHRKDQ